MKVEFRDQYGYQLLIPADKKYGNHSIGDMCSSPRLPNYENPTAAKWLKLRHAFKISAQLKQLRDYLSTNETESIADFDEKSTFIPDSYPDGTLLLLGQEADLSQTRRTRVRKKEFRGLRGPVFDEQPRTSPEWHDDGQWQKKEEYQDDSAFKGSSIGIVMRLIKESRHLVLVGGDRNSILSGKTDLRFLKGEFSFNQWSHTIKNVLDYDYSFMDPDFIRSIQQDLFQRFTGVKILKIGKEIAEADSNKTNPTKVLEPAPNL